MPAVEPLRAQNYKELKKELLGTGKLFVDQEFPPNDVFRAHTSTNSTRAYRLAEAWSKLDTVKLRYKRHGYKSPHRCKRQHHLMLFSFIKRHSDIRGVGSEIVQNPRLFVEGVSSDDVTQGILGNCWFVAACSALTHYKELWTKVIPDAEEQEWDPENTEKYCGIFHFCFWRFGVWVDVVVDDLLPCHGGQLLYARSKTRNEFWSVVNEYFRLNGCYESLVGGSLAEALVDITGGVPETIDLTTGSWKDSEDSRAQLFVEMKEAFESKSLMAAAIAASSADEIEKPLECGLGKGHSYVITAIRNITLDLQVHRSLFTRLFPESHSQQKARMVRLRNPWDEQEWTGAWADGSPEWDLISKGQKRELGFKVEEDGEFWMSFDDFIKYFTDVSICHLFCTNLLTLRNNRYKERSFKGLWLADSDPLRAHLTNRAGGCTNFKDSFLQNSQYFLVVNDDNSSVIVSLMQRDIRERRRQAASYLTIGMHVMKVEDNRRHRLHQIMRGVGTSEYVDTRSVFLRLKGLRKGCYVIVPTTLAPGEEGEFFLRIFSFNSFEAGELFWDLPSSQTFCRCFRRKPLCCTRVHVLTATNLPLPHHGSINLYCVVSCEKFKFTSSVAQLTTNPEFDFDFALLFLRRRPEKPIIIEIYSKNVLKDEFLGRAEIICPIDNQRSRLEVTLTDRHNKQSLQSSSVKEHGKLIVDIATHEDPVQL